MNIATNVNESATETNTTLTFYANLNLNQLAADINSGKVAHKFDGKGRKLVELTEAQEQTYLFYSTDSAGTEVVTPPFDIYFGDTVECSVQQAPSDGDNVKAKWQGIIQDNFNLQKVKASKKMQAAYLAVLPQHVRSETDNVSIFAKFTVNGEKFLVGWDPQVKVVRPN